MVKAFHMAEAAKRTGVIACHRHFGVPSLGLQPHQIGGDDVLLKEIVLRSRVEYVAVECCADDKPLKPDDMARRFELLLTCDTSDPPVPLSGLVHEVKRRAEAGSAISICFLREYDIARALHPGCESVEIIVHSLFVRGLGLPSSDFVRQFLGNHRMAQAESAITDVD